MLINHHVRAIILLRPQYIYLDMDGGEIIPDSLQGFIKNVF